MAKTKVNFHQWFKPKCKWRHRKERLEHPLLYQHGNPPFLHPKPVIIFFGNLSWTHNVSSVLLPVCAVFICWRSLVCLGRQPERTICALSVEQDVFIPREVWRYKWYLLLRTHYFYGVTSCLFKPLVSLRRCSFSCSPKSYQQRARAYLSKMSRL